MNLTNQLLTTYYGAVVDLGPGYPSIELPEWLLELSISNKYLKKMYHLSHRDHRRFLGESNSFLSKSAARFINIPCLEDANSFITSSGAESINRVLAAEGTRIKKIGLPKPTIDLYYDTVKEYNIEAAYYDVGLGGFYDLEELKVFIDSSKIEALVVVAPNNPTGTTIGYNQFDNLVTICLEKKITLIIDACFCRVGNDSPYIQEITEFPKELSWYFLWDTGKTFPLRHRKFGCVWCGNNEVLALGEKIRNITFEIPISEKEYFADVLELSVENSYLKYFNDIINNNKKLIKSHYSNAIYSPDYGSYVSLNINDISPLQNPSEFMIELFRAERVGTTSWNVFLPDTVEKCDPLIRLSVSRNKDVVKKGIEKIDSFLNHSSALLNGA